MQRDVLVVLKNSYMNMTFRTKHYRNTLEKKIKFKSENIEVHKINECNSQDIAVNALGYTLASYVSYPIIICPFVYLISLIRPINKRTYPYKWTF